jgi:hypothetical protein
LRLQGSRGALGAGERVLGVFPKLQIMQVKCVLAYHFNKSLVQIRQALEAKALIPYKDIC